MYKRKKRKNKMGKKIMTILVVGIMVSTLFPLSPIVSGVGGSTAIAESPIESTYDFDGPSEQKTDVGGNMYNSVSIPTSSLGKGNHVGTAWSVPQVQQSQIGSNKKAYGASNPRGFKVFSPKTNRWTTSPGSYAKQKPLMEFNDTGMAGAKMDYYFPLPEVSTKGVDGTTYQYLHIDGFGLLGEVGKPALPMRNYIVAVPIGGEVQIEVLEQKSAIYDGYLIHPALEPAWDSGPDPEFVIDDEFYKSDQNYPEVPVCIAAINKLRGIPLAQVQICPVQYNPGRKQLTVYSQLKFRVVFTGGTELDPVANTPHFYELLNNIVINSEVIPTAEVEITDNMENGRSDIIIVTHSNYLTAANTLAAWKRQMGYTVEVVSQASWTSSQVKDAIHDRYAAWTPKPDYFVIIGDHGDVPAEVSLLNNWHVTDLYYACMDGTSDYYPDMAHGRISVSSATEANNVIDKIVNYERDPSSSASFYTHGTTCAMFQDEYNPPTSYKDGYADRRFAQTSEEIRDHLMSEGYTIDRIYDLEDDSIIPTHWNNGKYSTGEAIPAELLKPGFAWDGDTTDIINSVDTGRFILFHRDHGAWYRWGHPIFYTSNISSLNNGDMLPVVFSINCYTGEFNLAECFAEKFLRYDGTTKGAVGVFAASDTSYSGWNDGLAEGFIDAIWPGLVPLFPHNPSPTVTPHDPMYAMGDVLNQGKFRMDETWDQLDPYIQVSKYTFELFHYFGDPTMKIWTAVPQTITATYGDYIEVGQTSFDISDASCDSGIATLYYDGAIIGKGTLVSGACTIPISPTPSTPGGTALLTVTEHNYHPTQDALDVIQTFNCILGDICVNASGWWRSSSTFNQSTMPIQHAINNAIAGNTIYVYNGTYTEDVLVNKTLTLRGEGTDVVNVTNSTANHHVFELTADYVNISGFNVSGATGSGKAGFYLSGRQHCNVSCNTVSNNNNGIYLSTTCDNNTLTKNNVWDNTYGINLCDTCNNNNITCNWVHSNTQRGFNLTGGSIGNNISHNNIIANGEPQIDGSYQWQFYNNQTEDVDAAHNWWGTDNETKINASIYDWDNDNTKGIVTFLPKLDTGAPCAPIPELPTIILVSVGLVMIAGYRRIRRKS